jgi:hypothetical protein
MGSTTSLLLLLLLLGLLPLISFCFMDIVHVACFASSTEAAVQF